MCDFNYLLGKTMTQARRTWVHAVWSTLAIVGPFFKFTIVKLNETIINDLNWKKNSFVRLWVIICIKEETMLLKLEHTSASVVEIEQ